MSVFSSIALPGGIPTLGPARGRINPEALFSGESEKEIYRNILEGARGTGTKPNFKVKNVCVRIFDLSDDAQRTEYEKLWKELLEKASRMEVIVDHHKDLVQRKDGSSYWMKYVEYVEFGDANESSSDKKNGEG